MFHSELPNAKAQIAERLFTTPGTASVHVSDTLAGLRRAQPGGGRSAAAGAGPGLGTGGAGGGERATAGGRGPAQTVQRLVMGTRRSRLRLRELILVPGADWRRLYSARSTMRMTRRTSSGSYPAKTSSASPLSVPT